MITLQAERAYELRTERAGRVERSGYDLLLGAAGNYPIADWGQQAFTPLPFGASRQLPHCQFGKPYALHSHFFIKKS